MISIRDVNFKLITDTGLKELVPISCSKLKVTREFKKIPPEILFRKNSEEYMENSKFFVSGNILKLNSEQYKIESIIDYDEEYIKICLIEI